MANARPNEQKFAGLRLETVEEDGTFAGYASLFGRIDLGKDIIEQGAFARSLRERGAKNIHAFPARSEPADRRVDGDQGGCARPARARPTGQDVGRAREVLSLMRGGALDGLSIGFRTVRARSEAGTGVRRVLEADLWEISVVTFPMQPEARIHAVKSVTGAPLPTIREFERWLTRDAGLTRGDAQAVIAKGFARLKRERDAAQALPGRSPSGSRWLDPDRRLSPEVTAERITRWSAASGRRRISSLHSRKDTMDQQMTTSRESAPEDNAELSEAFGDFITHLRSLQGSQRPAAGRDRGAGSAPMW